MFFIGGLTMQDLKYFKKNDMDLRVFLDLLYRIPVKDYVRKTYRHIPTQKPVKKIMHGRLIRPIISKSETRPPDWAKTARYVFRG